MVLSDHSIKEQLLQGRIRIEPLDPEGRQAQIRLAWHDAFMVEDASVVRETSRIDM